MCAKRPTARSVQAYLAKCEIFFPVQLAAIASVLNNTTTAWWSGNSYYKYLRQSESYLKNFK